MTRLLASRRNPWDGHRTRYWVQQPEHGPKLLPRTGPVRTPSPLWLSTKPCAQPTLGPQDRTWDREVFRERGSKFLMFKKSFLFLCFCVSGSKFRRTVFGWCCLGYMPEPQLQRSLGNQASDIFPLLQWEGTCPTKTYEVGNSQTQKGVPDAVEQKSDQYRYNSYFS